MVGDLLSPKEFASRVGVSQRTIQRLCEAGEVEGALRVGQQFRIPVSAIDGFLVDVAEGERTDAGPSSPPPSRAGKWRRIANEVRGGR